MGCSYAVVTHSKRNKTKCYCVDPKGIRIALWGIHNDEVPFDTRLICDDKEYTVKNDPYRSWMDCWSGFCKNLYYRNNLNLTLYCRNTYKCTCTPGNTGDAIDTGDTHAIY